MIDEERNSGGDDTSTAELVRPESGDAKSTDTGAKASDTSTETTDTSDKDSGDKLDGSRDLFGADWREKLTSALPEDQKPKAEQYLKTRSSPFEILRAGMSADAKISELTRDRVKIPTGKNDDPKDVAAFRKARGVPESPEKYDVRVPEEYGELSPLDQELKDEFLKKAHENHWSQRDIDLAIDTHFTIQRLAAAEQAKQIVGAQQAAIDELRVEYGKEYRPNVELVNRMFEQELSEVGLTEPDQRREFLSQRFTNGMALGEYPPFVKMMVKLARERADDGALVMGETTDGGDIDGRVKTIMDKMHTDPKEYERMQPELQRLIAAQNRRKGK
jgi:hypothetical protein